MCRKSLFPAAKLGQRPSLGGIGLGQARVDGDGLLGRHQSRIHRPAGDIEQRPAESDRGQGAGIIGIDFQGLIAEPERRLQISGTALLQVVPGLEIELIGVRIQGRAGYDRLLLVRQQLHPQRRDDRLRDLVLQRENVVQIAVVALGPDMAGIFPIDQLRGDAHPPRPPAASLLPGWKSTRVALTGDLTDVDGVVLEGEHGIAGHDVKLRDPRQISDDVLRDAGAEVILRRVAGHVAKRQDSDGNP